MFFLILISNSCISNGSADSTTRLSPEGSLEAGVKLECATVGCTSLALGATDPKLRSAAGEKGNAARVVEGDIDVVQIKIRVFPKNEGPRSKPRREC